MAFIQTIPLSEADGPVREMYQQVERRFGYVLNRWPPPARFEARTAPWRTEASLPKRSSTRRA